MRIIFEDRPGRDFVYSLANQVPPPPSSPLIRKADIDAMKERPFIIKEGANFKIQIAFRVQHEIVAGLKYLNMVYKMGVRGTLPPPPPF
jgi:Rho GDP-dissociation inhibitor